MMNRIYKIGMICLWAGLVASACERSEDVRSSSNVLRMSVSACGYSDADETRSDLSDIELDKMNFVSGDCLGLIVVSDDEVSQVKCVYDGAEWSVSGNAGYSPTSEYYAYFPYSEAFTGMTLEQIREEVSPAVDQRAAEAFRSSNLFVCDDVRFDDNVFTVRLVPDGAMVAVAQYRRRYFSVEKGDRTGFFKENVWEQAVAEVGDVYYQLFLDSDGVYKAIVPDGEEIRSFVVKCSGESVVLSLPEEKSSRSGCYCLVRPEDENIGDYNESGIVKPGDYLCRDDDQGGAWYLLPSGFDLADYDACVGIVFHVGRYQAETDSDTSDYSVPMEGRANLIEGNDVTGYAMALTDVNEEGLSWESRSGDGEWMTAIGTSRSQTDWNGYDNQRIFHKFVSQNEGWAMADFPAASGCEHYGEDSGAFLAPSNSSGWFLPSSGQLEYIAKQKAVLQSSVNALKEVLNNERIVWFDNPYSYWASSEGAADSDAQSPIMWSNGRAQDVAKYYKRGVRAILAF